MHKAGLHSFILSCYTQRGREIKLDEKIIEEIERSRCKSDALEADNQMCPCLLLDLLSFHLKAEGAAVPVNCKGN